MAMIIKNFIVSLLVGASTLLNEVANVGEWFDGLFTGVTSAVDGGDNFTINYTTLACGKYGDGQLSVPKDTIFSMFTHMYEHGYRYVDIEMYSMFTIDLYNYCGHPVSDKYKMMQVSFRRHRFSQRSYVYFEDVESPEEFDVFINNLTQRQIVKLFELKKYAA